MLRRLLLCLLLSPIALASAEHLRLVSGDDYAPFSGQQLPGGGMLTQVVQAALRTQAITSSIDWRPWNRGYMMAAKGEYDGTFPYVRTAEREREFIYSAPLFLVKQHLFSRAGEVFEPDDLSALTGKRICYPLGWQPPPAIRQMIEDGQLSRHSPAGLDECAKLLLLSRDDFFVGDARLGAAAMRSTGELLTRFRRSQGKFTGNALHLLVSRRHPHAQALIDAFDRGLAVLRKTGEYQRIIDGVVSASTE